MTAQVHDSLQHCGEQHVLLACSDGQPFYPVDAGYRPFMKSTACWRGYIAQYQVVDGQLQLHDLSLNHRPRVVPGPRRLEPPSLNGVQAIREDEMFFCGWGFSNANLPLGYTGGVVIGRDFVDDLSTHRGFDPVWEYRRVQELVFDKGRLVETNDASNDLDRRRIALKSQGAFDDIAKLGLIDAKTIGGFSRSYFQ